MSPITRLFRPAAQRAASLALLGLMFVGNAAFAQDAAPTLKPRVVSAFSESHAKENLPEGTTRPKAIFESCAKPEWPEESLKAGQTGTVTLSFLIGDDGTMREGKILKSSGSRLLDKAAYEGISKCRFTPATVAGKPVTHWMQMQYVWSLE